MSDNPLNHLGRDVRILAALIDALIAGLYAGAIYQWRIEGLVRTAIKQERIQRRASTARDVQALQSWGAIDPDPEVRFGQICQAAGLSAKQAEVAFWHFDRGMKPAEMAHNFGGDPIRLGAHLQEVKEKLVALGRRTNL